MNNQNKKTELLGSAPVPKALLAMGLPTMLGMLINALYSLADAYFVSGLGERQMGAVAVVYPLGQVIVGLGLLFGNGAASYISRLLGSGEIKKAQQTAATALTCSLSAGAALIFLSLLALKPLLILFGATNGILPYAASYARIYIVSCIFNVFNVTMNNLAASEGAAKMTMCTLLAGALLNIALDPLFIYGLGLQVAGAAAATAVSQMISAALYALYLCRGRSILRFRPENICFSRQILGEIFKIGIPTLTFQLLTSLCISLTNHAASNYGDTAIAAFGVVTRLMSVGSLAVYGFIKGFQPIAGYSWGAKNLGRLRSAIRISILWSTGFCMIFGLSCALFPAHILSLFAKNSAAMTAVGAAALRANGITFILFGFYTVYSSLFLALGKGREGFFLGACRQGICFVPAILILPAAFGLNGIIYAQPAADVLAALAAGVMAVSLNQKALHE